MVTCTTLARLVSAIAQIACTSGEPHRVASCCTMWALLGGARTGAARQGVQDGVRQRVRLRMSTVIHGESVVTAWARALQ